MFIRASNVRLSVLLSVFLIISLCFGITLFTSKSYSETDSQQTTLSHITLDFKESYPLSKSISYVEDKSQKHQLQDAIQLNRLGQFKSGQKDILNFGFTDSAYWFYFKVTNLHQSNTHWVLKCLYPLLDRMDVYIIDSADNVKAMSAGDSVSYDKRSHPHLYSNFDIMIDQNETVEVYMRAKTEGAIQMPLLLSSKKEFDRDHFQKVLILGAYYGVIVALALYNLVVFLSIRDRNYFYYVLFIISFSLFQLTHNGFFLKFIWPESPEYSNPALAVFMNLALVFICLFTRTFLDLKKNLPIFYRLFQALILFSVTLSVGTIVMPYNTQVVISSLLTVVVAVCVISSSIICLLKGVKEARYFLLSFAFLMLGILFYSLKSFGFISTNIFTEHIMQVGSALQVILLSFALVDKFRLIAEAHDRIQLRTNEQLEIKVRERTSELKKANEALENLSQTDGLTGLKNRRYLDQVLLSEIKRASRKDAPFSLILLDVDHFKQFNDTWGHIGGDHCLVTLASVLKDLVKRDSDTLARYGGEEFAIILPQTNAQGAEITAERVRTAIENTPIEVEGQQTTITISLGVAEFCSENKCNQEQLLRQADQALYQSKKSGRNRVTLFQN